jgi:hypothetical protein
MLNILTLRSCWLVTLLLYSLSRSPALPITCTQACHPSCHLLVATRALFSAEISPHHRGMQTSAVATTINPAVSCQVTKLSFPVICVLMLQCEAGGLQQTVPAMQCSRHFTSCAPTSAEAGSTSATALADSIRLVRGEWMMNWEQQPVLRGT